MGNQVRNFLLIFVVSVFAVMVAVTYVISMEKEQAMRAEEEAEAKRIEAQRFLIEQCNTWYDSIEDRRVQLANNIFASQEAWDRFNEDVDRYNYECAGGPAP